MNRLNALFISLLLTCISAFGQQTAIYEEPGNKFTRALELFDRDKFAPAHKLFTDLSAQLEGTGSQMETNADFYAALCAIKLKNGDGAHLMEQFLLKHPSASKSQPAHFYLGLHYFGESKWKDAIEHFAIVDPSPLNPEDLSEYQFKAGYAYFMIKDNARASKYFHDIKNTNSKWGSSATYYYAHIAYSENKYETALTEFRRLQKDSNYEDVVPYYIVQILYLQQKYNDLLAEAPPLLEKAEQNRKGSIAAMIADAAYKTNDYSKALLYIEQYESLSKKPLTRNENYLLAFSAYKTGDIEKAIPAFQNAVRGRDSLSQNAMYHIGDCYLKTGQKALAQKAFYDAYKISYDQSSKENSLFNYAKLSYELSSDPYNAAIIALQEYVSTYPESPRADEAWQYLVNLALVSKNYKAALEAMDKVKFQDIKIKTARQKVLYYSAIELFNARKYNDAIEGFTRASEMNYDKMIKPMSLYWAGEAAYRMGEYRPAIGWYNRFLISRGAYDMPEYPIAIYNSGYAWYKMKEYGEAIISFRKFLGNTANKDPQMVSDAQLRLGDCYFITKQFADAVNWYEKVSRSGSFDADYAFFQLAMAKGVTKNFEGKTIALKQLIRQFPKSPLVDDALYELAVTYLIMNENDEALDNLQVLISKFPNSSFTSRAMLRRGLIFYNTNQNEQALQQLKQVVTQYPGTPDSREALQTISNIYVELNDVPSYLSYIQTVPFAKIPMARQDSLTYLAAENQYMKGDCNNSLKGFSDYLQKNPQGIFSASAYYYRGDCRYRQGELALALPDFKAVAKMPRSRFTENALARASELEYKEGKYGEALRLFEQLNQLADNKDNLLESTAGMMRCYFRTGSNDSAIIAATRLMTADKVTTDLLVEAHLTIGKAALATNNLQLAEREFNITHKLTQTEAGAEALYSMAYISSLKKDWKQAEKLAFEVINTYTLYDYWRVKSFLLLSDVYTNTNNAFQAKQTLESILENYDGEDLKQEAQQRLDKLNSSEN